MFVPVPRKNYLLHDPYVSYVLDPYQDSYFPNLVRLEKLLRWQRDLGWREAFDFRLTNLLTSCRWTLSIGVHIANAHQEGFTNGRRHVGANRAVTGDKLNFDSVDRA